MDLSLDESQQILVDTFAELLQKECPIGLVRACEEDRGGSGVSAELWARYCELGANVMGLPEEAGGLEMSLLDLGLVATESGKALAPVPFIEIATSGRLLASLDVEDPLLADLVEGKPNLSLSLPRPHAIVGTDVGSSTRSVIPFGAAAEHVIAFQGDELYVVSAWEARRSQRVMDVGAGSLAYWDLSRTGASDARVLASGPRARSEMARASAEWKLLTAFWLVGLAQRSLSIGAAYARERIQFGVPIGGFQAIAHPLAECATRVDGAELLAWEGAWAHLEDPDRFEAVASMAFVWAAQTALRTADVSLHTHGGYGFSTEYDIQLFYRRACAVPGILGSAREELQTVAELHFEPDLASSRLPSSRHGGG